MIILQFQNVNSNLGCIECLEPVLKLICKKQISTEHFWYFPVKLSSFFVQFRWLWQNITSLLTGLELTRFKKETKRKAYTNAEEDLVELEELIW